MVNVGKLMTELRKIKKKKESIQKLSAHPEDPYHLIPSAAQSFSF